VAQPGGRTFAELLALLTDDYDGLAGETTRPVLDIAMGAAARARNQAGVCREVVVNAESISVAALAVPMSRDSLSEEIVV